MAIANRVAEVAAVEARVGAEQQQVALAPKLAGTGGARFAEADEFEGIAIGIRVIGEDVEHHRAARRHLDQVVNRNGRAVGGVEEQVRAGRLAERSAGADAEVVPGARLQAGQHGADLG